ncbi:MAG: dihydrodipicolinate reductase C-terminal domain-containing protein [Pseudomonadota bacterium]
MQLQENTGHTYLAQGHGPIRVGLVGFGKAGQAVCMELLKAPDIDLRWVLRRQSQGPDTAEAVVGDCADGTRTPLFGLDTLALPRLLEEQPVDFLVDFSAVGSCRLYAGPAAEAGVGIISAISHYGDEEAALLRELGARIPVLHSPNITVGINFVLLAAKMLQRLAPHADIEIVEEHFRAKGEISGTARRIAQELGLDEALHLNSIRVGGIVGRHEVIFGFPYQTVRLAHDSISRQAFGQGALFALRALRGRDPGFYTMQQLVAERFAEAAGD